MWRQRARHHDSCWRLPRCKLLRPHLFLRLLAAGSATVSIVGVLREGSRWMIADCAAYNTITFAPGGLDRAALSFGPSGKARWKHLRRGSCVGFLGSGVLDRCGNSCDIVGQRAATVVWAAAPDQVELTSEEKDQALFEKCLQAFTVDASDLDRLDLPCLGVKAAQQLMSRGYAVLDDFVPPKAAAAVAAIAKESLADYPTFKDDGIHWLLPEPRHARDDLTTFMRMDSRPAKDPAFAQDVLPNYLRLVGDLAKIMVLRQEGIESQLAWYPKGSKGYKPHLDRPLAENIAWNLNRQVTCILYCNEGWQPSHGGLLRFFLPPSVGGGTTEVEPIAGRLVVFLSGCMRHEVLPSSKDRFAVTLWSP